MTDPDEAPTIAGYRVVRLLGHGAMGSVWLAVDRQGREVAVKVADRARRLAQPRREEMFRRESVVALNLRHPNLVRGLEVGETTDGRPFLAMELVVGETLARRMAAAGPLPEREVLRLGHALASALEHAHSLGIVHRDVKPENVMLLEDGSIRLLDFSIVAETDREEGGCGTPAFVSPEAILKQPMGPASDLYSLGVTLASAAIGRPYFTGPDVRTVLKRNLREPLELPAVVDGVPLSEGFRAVIARLGRKRPEERPGSAGEARLDFAALLAGERPLGAYLGMARFGHRRRSRAVLVATAAVAALGVAIGVWRLSSGASRPPRPVGVPPVGPMAGSGPPTAATPSAPAAAPEDPAVEVALLYVEEHPEELAKAKAMLARAAAGSPSLAQGRRLAEARRMLERREGAAADAELARRLEAARARAQAADLAGLDELAAGWPAHLAGTPQEREAERGIADLRASLVAAGDRLLGDATAVVERWERGDPPDAADVRRTLEALDRFIATGPRTSEPRRRAATLRGRVEAQRASADRAAAARASRDALAAFQVAMARDDPDDIKRALEALAGLEEASPALAEAAREVVARARAVDVVLSRRTEALATAVWAGILDGRLVVGRPAPPPVARRVFLPPLTGLPAASPGGIELGDLRSLEPEPERLAAWLILVGATEAARSIAPPTGMARLLLDGLGETAHPAPEPSGLEAELRARATLVLRAPEALPPPTPAVEIDEVVTAWSRAIRRGRGDARRDRRTELPLPAALEAARIAYFEDDWTKAWSALDTAAAADVENPEIAMLRCRVLETAAEPLRTFGISLFALSEAKRARDLDPSLPAAWKLLVEQCLLFRSRHPGAFADALAPTALAACLEVDRLGQADAAVLTFVGEQKLLAGRPADAVAVLRRAARLAPEDPNAALAMARAAEATGDLRQARASLLLARSRLAGKMPPWAAEMLIRLSGP